MITIEVEPEDVLPEISDEIIKEEYFTRFNTTDDSLLQILYDIRYKGYTKEEALDKAFHENNIYYNQSLGSQ